VIIGSGRRLSIKLRMNTDPIKPRIDPPSLRQSEL
jgi:hypothetical protein